MLLAKAYRPDPRVYKEAMTLVKNGFKVFILCWDREGKYPQYKKEMNVEIFQFRFLKIEDYNLFKFPLCLLLFNILCILWSVTRRIDYVHSNDFDTLPAGYTIGKIKRVKLVYDAHESYVDAISPHVPKFIQKVVAIAESLLIRKADSVITENKNKKNILIKRGAKKVDILPNYPMVSLFRALDQKDSKRALGVEEKFVVLYIGEVMPGRNLKLLVDLARLLKARGIEDFVFLIVGEGVLLPQLKKMVQIQKLSNYFVFVEWVSPENVPLYYAASDIVYILLEREPINIISMPNKLFEAIASGKTVLASDFGKIAEVVKATDCGLLCSSIKADIVLNMLISVKDNPALRQTIKKQTAEIEQVYAWEKVDHILANIYV
jgi:glycosyltransferase involved in cell wall biosynthesis